MVKVFFLCKQPKGTVCITVWLSILAATFVKEMVITKISFMFHKKKKEEKMEDAKCYFGAVKL